MEDKVKKFSNYEELDELLSAIQQQMFSVEMHARILYRTALYAFLLNAEQNISNARAHLEEAFYE